MSLQDLADRVLSFRGHKNKGLSSSLDAGTRAERAGNIAEYLLKNEERFFNSMS